MNAANGEPTLRDLLTWMVDVARDIDVFDPLLDFPLVWFAWAALAVVGYFVLLRVVTRWAANRRARKQEAQKAAEAPSGDS